MRGWPDMPAIGRAAGFALVAAAIVAAAAHFRHGAGGPTAASRAVLAADPLAAALAHCQAMGAAAQSDPGCESAWAENRRRFFMGGGTTDVVAARIPSAKDR